MGEPPDRERPDEAAGRDPKHASGPVVELGPPISDVPWSSEFAQQSLEVLILLLDEGSVAWLKPMHADSLHVGLPVSSSPGDVVIETLGWFGLIPRVVHSTSWRHEEGRLVLTYIAVVEPPSVVPQDTLQRVEVVRAGLARGDATARHRARSVSSRLSSTRSGTCRGCFATTRRSPRPSPTGPRSWTGTSRSRSGRSAKPQTSMITGRITGFRWVTS
jgi:hypothetical protein